MGSFSSWIWFGSRDWPLARTRSSRHEKRPNRSKRSSRTKRDVQRRQTPFDRSRHELGLTQSCEVRRLIVQIQRKNKAKTKRFILAYRLINFATPSVAFDLHVNLKYNYSKWRRFCTSSARPKILMALRLWNPRDRYPIVHMEPTPAENRVAFSFVERNYLRQWTVSHHAHGPHNNSQDYGYVLLRRKQILFRINHHTGA